MDARCTGAQLTGSIIGAAIEVHRVLGPGLLESAYESCLAHELRLRGLEVRCQVPLPVVYKGTPLDVGYRLDLVVEDRVLVETKCTESILPIHRAQILTYLRLSGLRLGLLLDFKVATLRDGGIERFAN